jgi:type IV pilus assembly protein PilY1
VFVPTYDRIVSTPTSSACEKFDRSPARSSSSPTTRAIPKTHSLTGSGSLAQGNNSFSSNVQWDAQTAMPAPDKRNLFTYVGGYLSVPASNVAKQAGWAPADLDYTSIQSPISTCTDNWSLGRISKDATRNKPGPYAGMTVGSNGVCDVEELLAANLVLNASDFGSDQGASAAEQTAIVNKLQSTAVNGGLQVTRQLTQLVRGYCFATVGAKDGAGAMVNNPTSTQCNYKRQDNVNSVGGFVHSQAAVIPPSASVMDSPNGKHRPTVAYAGGLDGQLHAFYVPGPDTNDAGYAGPANALHLPFTAAKTTFHTDWLGSGSFSPPAPLTELWSFVPPGQAPFLYSNDAMVDASPAVLDIFADLDGDGIREWHTVLVASAGGSNREIFALDVSNPLAPALLWDIQSSFDSTSIPYAPVPLMDDDTGKALVSGEQAFLWQNHCRAAAVTASTCTAATYALPPLADAGRSTTGLFNYQHLGASQSVQAALLRRNNAPVYAAFVSANEPGGNGMYVFAIDISPDKRSGSSRTRTTRRATRRGCPTASTTAHRQASRCSARWGRASSTPSTPAIWKDRSGSWTPRTART